MKKLHIRSVSTILFTVFVIVGGLTVDRSEATTSIPLIDQIAQWNTSTIISDATMIRIAEIESNFRPKAKSPTGCKGLFQFCSKTWKWMVELYGARDGVKMGDIWQAKANTLMAVRLAETNYREFTKFNFGRITPEPYEIYMMHNIGIGGTIALMVENKYGDPNTIVTKELIGSNPRHNPKYLTNKGKPITVGQAISNYREDFKDVN